MTSPAFTTNWNCRSRGLEPLEETSLVPVRALILVGAFQIDSNEPRASALSQGGEHRGLDGGELVGVSAGARALGAIRVGENRADGRGSSFVCGSLLVCLRIGGHGERHEG